MHEGSWTLVRLPARGAGRARSRARGQRADGRRPRPARLRRPRRRRGASSTASCRRTTRSCSATWRVACERIRAAVAAGRRICVHGDYDVDGIAATALAVLLLRELGADVDWHLPSRFDEGYGVSSETLARLADEGCGLVLTVDCGITAAAEVAEAKARGLEVDRHRPPPTRRDAARLPDRRDAAVRLSVPRALRHRRRLQARPGAVRRRLGDPEAAPRPRRPRDDRRRRPAGRREPRRSRSPGCARSRARRSPGCRR